MFMPYFLQKHVKTLKNTTEKVVLFWVQIIHRNVNILLRIVFTELLLTEAKGLRFASILQLYELTIINNVFEG